MKKMKKLALVLLSLCCVSAIGGIAACKEDGGKSQINQETVFIDKLAITMRLGETEKLLITGAGANTPTFVSSNESVATVDENGNVTAVATGSATITVTVGEETLTCVVSVPDVSVSTMVLRNPEEKLSVGMEKKLQVTLSPAIATDKELTWSSSNEDVVTVEQDGTICGVALGSATITVKNEASGKTATCEITVGTPVENVTLDQTSINVLATKIVRLSATITPSEALIQDVTWTSSNKRIAEVNAIGDVLGVSEGTVTITATTADGNKVATCEVTVQPYYKVDFVEFAAEVINLGMGQVETLVPVVTPENATNKQLSWASSAPDVVTVDANGKVTANKAGSATITVVSTENVHIKNSVEINVIATQTTFKNEYYTPEGNFTMTAYNVNEVKFNGTALAAGEYTYENDVLSIAKKVLCDKATASANTLTLVSEESGNAEVAITVATAMGTNFQQGELGTEIFGYTEGVSGMEIVDGKLEISARASTQTAIAFNIDYLKAMFAYPNLQVLRLNIAVENITGKSTARLVKTNGTWGFSTNSIGNAFLSRTAFNKMIAEAEESPSMLEKNVYLHFAAGNVGANAKIIVKNVGAYIGSTTGEQNGKIYADMPADETIRVELSSPADVLTKFHVRGNNYDPDSTNAEYRGYTLEGNLLSIKRGAKVIRVNNDGSTSAATLPDLFAQNGQRLWFDTDYTRDCFYIYTTKTPDASQTFTKGTAYTYALANNQNALLKTVITSATLDGQDILAGEVEGVSVTDAGIVFAANYAGATGQHRLVIRAERTLEYNSQLWTAVDSYDRIVTAQ